MANKVRGLTIPIEADTSKFNAGLRGISKETKAAQTELNALKKGLALEYDDGKFKRAQSLAQDVLDTTAQKADALRARLKHLETAGAIDTDEYAKVRTELAKTETKAIEAKHQIEQLNKIKLDALTAKVDKVAAGFSSAASATRGLSLAAGGTIAALGGLGMAARNVGDEIGTAALAAGMTAEELQKMRYVALQTDVDTEKMSKGFIKARAALADLATGTVNTASTALQKLNIDFSQFKSTDDAFYGIINALGQMDNELAMTAAANEIFGDRLANEMIPIIKAGGGAIEEYAAEYENLGGLTNEQVEALGEFDNVMNRIETQIKNIALQFGAALLPVMERVASFVSEQIVPKLKKLSEWFSQLSTDQIEFGLKALTAVAMISPLLSMLGKISGGISSIMNLIPKLSGLMSTLSAHPVIAIIAVVAGLIMLLYTTNEKFRESINNLIAMLSGALSPLLDIITGLISSLFELLTPLISIVGDILAEALGILMSLLSPVINMVALLFKLLQPLINLALIPLQMAFKALQVPLQILASLLNWIMPIFNAFAKVVEGVFGFVIKIINTVLGWVENAINWVIDKINALIRGINNLGGWLGINITEIERVKLQIETGSADQYDGDTAIDTGKPPTEDDFGNYPYDGFDPDYGQGDTVNNDYSTNNTTQNVTVTIQNYAAEVDTDKLVKEINAKLAEAM